MKIQTESKFLAAACIYFGLMCAVLTVKFSSILSDLIVSAPLLTRVALAPGTIGWLIMFGGIATIILWKDSWERFQIPNSFIAATLGAIVWTFLAAMAFPLIGVFLFLVRSSS
jgi:hypothetical protein